MTDAQFIGLMALLGGGVFLLGFLLGGMAHMLVRTVV